MIEKGFESVTIGAVEKHIPEIAFAEGWVKPSRHATNGRRQSVSSGRSGWFVGGRILRHRGYQVHVYDRYDRIGGLLMYGIPGFSEGQ